jgi:D-tyrosyl-tRNA(Tyr) deacylase
MKIVLQRVSEASVSVEGTVVGRIGQGYLLFIGIETGDTEAEATWLARKITNLRLFTSEDGKINDRSLTQVQGSALVVSQFTLLGSVQGGNRPEYTAAAAPGIAASLVGFFVLQLRQAGVGIVEEGQFGAHMTVTLTNDGPVTLLLERRGGYHAVSNEL